MLARIPSKGQLFKEALNLENPLQIIGTPNALSALIAKVIGFKAIYLSGAGVAASLGLPDLGITTLSDVLEDARRITNAVDLPLLVDIDTGFGSTLNIQRTIREMIKIGAAGVHIEDQITYKRCGHRPGKILVTSGEMVDRLKAAIDSKTDAEFIIMARTDALAIEGLAQTLKRVNDYVEAGADMIFFEGATTLTELKEVTKHCKVPVLTNLTEFGVSPLFSKEELQEANVRMALYPLSALRAMNWSTLKLFEVIRNKGTQKNYIEKMQTRDELYQLLDYHRYEEKLNKSFSKENENE